MHPLEYPESSTTPEQNARMAGELATKATGYLPDAGGAQIGPEKGPSEGRPSTPSGQDCQGEGLPNPAPNGGFAAAPATQAPTPPAVTAPRGQTQPGSGEHSGAAPAGRTPNPLRVSMPEAPVTGGRQAGSDTHAAPHRAATKQQSFLERQMQQQQWLNEVPSAPVYEPTAAEWADPLAYIRSIQHEAARAGICIVRAPVVPAVPAGVMLQKFRFTTRQQRVKDVEWGRDWESGVRFLQGDKRLSLAEFQRTADDFARKRFGVAADLPPLVVEGEYWAERQGRMPGNQGSTVEYGNDVDGTAFHPDDALGSSAWNLNTLPGLDGSVLRWCRSTVAGVNTPMLYVGMLYATFAWHVEDHFLYSINYQHAGAPKIWYGVPAADADALEAAAARTVYRRACASMAEAGEGVEAQHRAAAAALMSKTTMLSPKLLQQHGVRCFRAVQEVGSYVITFPRAYHSGFSCGFNIGEAVNFALGDWWPFGEDARALYAKLNRQHILAHEQALCDEAWHLSAALPESPPAAAATAAAAAGAPAAPGAATPPLPGAAGPDKAGSDAACMGVFARSMQRMHAQRAALEAQGAVAVAACRADDVETGSACVECTRCPQQSFLCTVVINPQGPFTQWDHVCLDCAVKAQAQCGPQSLLFVKPQWQWLQRVAQRFEGSVRPLQDSGMTLPLEGLSAAALAMATTPIQPYSWASLAAPSNVLPRLSQAPQQQPALAPPSPPPAVAPTPAPSPFVEAALAAEDIDAVSLQDPGAPRDAAAASPPGMHHVQEIPITLEEIEEALALAASEPSGARPSAAVEPAAALPPPHHPQQQQPSPPSVWSYAARLVSFEQQEEEEADDGSDWEGEAVRRGAPAAAKPPPPSPLRKGRSGSPVIPAPELRRNKEMPLQESYPTATVLRTDAMQLPHAPQRMERHVLLVEGEVLLDGGEVLRCLGYDTKKTAPSRFLPRQLVLGGVDRELVYGSPLYLVQATLTSIHRRATLLRQRDLAVLETTLKGQKVQQLRAFAAGVWDSPEVAVLEAPAGGRTTVRAPGGRGGQKASQGPQPQAVRPQSQARKAPAAEKSGPSDVVVAPSQAKRRRTGEAPAVAPASEGEPEALDEAVAAVVQFIRTTEPCNQHDTPLLEEPGCARESRLYRHGTALLLPVSQLLKAADPTNRSSVSTALPTMIRAVSASPGATSALVHSLAPLRAYCAHWQVPTTLLLTRQQAECLAARAFKGVERNRAENFVVRAWGQANKLEPGAAAPAAAPARGGRKNKRAWPAVPAVPAATARHDDSDSDSDAPLLVLPRLARMMHQNPASSSPSPSGDEEDTVSVGALLPGLPPEPLPMPLLLQLSFSPYHQRAETQGLEKVAEEEEEQEAEGKGERMVQQEEAGKLYSSSAGDTQKGAAAEGDDVMEVDRTVAQPQDHEWLEQEEQWCQQQQQQQEEEEELEEGELPQ